MADTELLLGLVNEFSTAFADPEAAKPAAIPPTSPKTSQLMALVAEFPEAFADPEASLGLAAAKANALAKAAPAESAAVVAPTPEPAATVTPALSAGYRTALQRRVSTYTWGQVDCYFTYGEAGLQQFWVTVGKSGTEVQSLCEAIARLVNLLLAQRVALPEIVKQLRGIRGGTPEGLGPNTLLGLADLIGKVLQEAPPMGASGTVAAPATVVPTPMLVEVELVGESAVAAVASTPAASVAPAHDWVGLSDDLLAATLCPECGAQLQQMNGCSGGACTVCGYSSCS
jgi:hypothetical protein